MKIEGICQRGLGAATNNLCVQLPLIAKEFPEVEHCHRGTINLCLDFPLLVLAPDHRTKPIPWFKCSTGQGEVFDFLRIRLEAPIGNAALPAWLYIPHGSPHRTNLRHHEIIAPKVSITMGDRCLLYIERNVVQMPYQYYPVHVVA